MAIAELLYGFIKFNPFVPRAFVFPQNSLITKLQETSGIDRFWGYGTAQIEANFGTQTKLFSSDGTDPLNLAWYNQFLQSSGNGNIELVFNRTTRSDAKIAPGYGKEDLPSNEFRLRVMDMLGVKYVLDRSENPQDEHTFATDRFMLLAKVDEWRIYKNLMAAPRFFVTTDVRPYVNTADFEKQFFDPEFDPAKTVLVEQKDRNTIPKLTPIERVNTAKLIFYKPNSVAVSVKTDGDAFLFLSDTYDNGWTATVNGKSARVIKTNFSFRGVVVPEGESTVVLSYAPKSFITGVTISLFAVLATFGYILYEYKTKRQK